MLVVVDVADAGVDVEVDVDVDLDNTGLIYFRLIRDKLIDIRCSKLLVPPIFGGALS